MKKYVKLSCIVLFLMIGTLSTGFGESIALDYVYDGSGTKTLTLNTSDAFFVNSWNVVSVTINGTTHANRYYWFGTCGTYEIVFESSSPYGHIELRKSGACTVSIDATTAPTDAPTAPPATGAPTSVPTNPPAGGSLIWSGGPFTFDGSSDYQTLPTGVANTTDFTFAAWVKWDGGGNWQRIFDFGADTTKNMFLTPGNGSNMRFAITTSGSGSEQGINTSTLATGSWKHVAVTMSGNTGRLYIGGSEVASNTSISIDPGDLGASNCWLGKSQYADPYFDGQMEQIKIYDYALSSSEISSLAANPPEDPTSPPTSPPATDAPTAPPATDAPTAPPATDAPTAPPAVTDAPTDVPTDIPTTAPTNPPVGNGFLIPGLIQAEDFNSGGEGVGYHDTNGAPVLETNPGGQHIAYIESGEWLAYTVSATEGNYYIDAYVASADGGGSFHIEFNDVDVTGAQSFEANGSWTDFIPVTIGPVFISGGEQIMKLGMNGSSFNVDRLVLTETSETPSPSPTPTAVPTPSPVPPAVPQLHTDGIWIRDSGGNAVVLRGVATGDLDAIYKGDRSRLIQTTMFDIIDYAEQRLGNVYVIRLCIHPEVNDETGNHGWLHYDPNFYFENIIDPAVQHVISKGMYAIVDWHYVGQGWTGDTATNTEKFWCGSGSWAGIASKYANNPNVIFELFNEPGGGSWSGWKSAAEGWIGKIRAKGANNIVIVGGPNWSQLMPQNESELLDAENIVYACHIYPAHSGGGMPNWIEYVSSAAPVMMTEWGYENNSDANVTTGTKSSYGQKFRDYIDAKPQIGWIAWCFDYCYRSVMCDMNWKVLGNGDSTSSTRYHGGNTDTYENYMGYFVKDWLYDRRNDYSPGSGGTGSTTVPTDAPTSPPATDAPTSPPTTPPTSPPATDAPTTPPTDAPISAPVNNSTGSFTGDSESNPLMISSPNTETMIDLSHGYCWVGFGRSCGGMQFSNTGGQFDIIIEYNAGAERKSSSLTWSWGPGIRDISLIKVVKNSGHDSCRLAWW